MNKGSSVSAHMHMHTHITLDTRIQYVILVCTLTFLLMQLAGLWSLVVPNRNPGEVHSPLADHALLLILVLIHQQTKAHNPYRTALYTFSDEHDGKGVPSFSISLEKLYLSLCQ